MTDINALGLKAAGGPQVSLPVGRPEASGQISVDGAGASKSGFSAVGSVILRARATLTGSPTGSLALFVEHADDGGDWSTLQEFDFTATGVQLAEVTPKDQIRCRWVKTGAGMWSPVVVDAILAEVNEPSGGSAAGILGNGQSVLVTLFSGMELDFSIHPLQTIMGGNLVGGESPTGKLCGFAALPPLRFGNGTIIDLSNCAVELAGIVEAVDDPYDMAIDVVCFVSDGDGTNVAHAVIADEVAAPITDLAYVADLAGATWSIDAGDDLTAVGSVLSSAAGGCYSSWLAIQANWDS